MKSSAECYNIVKKDCFKFIKLQETPKEKFKNKEKMIKSFLIPISFWIANKVKKKNIMGVQFHPERSGIQGIQVYRNVARLIAAEQENIRR